MDMLLGGIVGLFVGSLLFFIASFKFIIPNINKFSDLQNSILLIVCIGLILASTIIGAFKQAYDKRTKILSVIVPCLICGVIIGIVPALIITVKVIGMGAVILIILILSLFGAFT